MSWLEQEDKDKILETILVDRNKSNLREANRKKLNPKLASPKAQKFDIEKMELEEVESNEISDDISQDDSEIAGVTNFMLQGGADVGSFSGTVMQSTMKRATTKSIKVASI